MAGNEARTPCEWMGWRPAVKDYVIGGSRTTTPAISRRTGAQSPCAASWLLDSYRILREPINGCKQASASPRGQCSARVARQTPRKHRQSTGQSQRGVREAPLTSVKHQDVYGHSGLQEPVSRSEEHT